MYMYIYIYICLYVYMSICICICICIHTYIHTYIHFPANSEGSESFRPLDRTSFILAHRHSAQWLAFVLSIGKLG